MLRLIAIFSFLLAFSVQGIAASDSMRFIHYDINNGMPSNNVYSVVKDNKGYIWFATDRGAARYNGYSFRNFDVGSGLPASDVWQLYPDSHGRLWAFTFGYRFGYIKDGKYKAINFKTDDRIITPYGLTEINGMVVFFNGSTANEGMMLVAGDIARYIRFNFGDLARGQYFGQFISPEFDVILTDNREKHFKINLLQKNARLTGGCNVSAFVQSGYRSKNSVSPSLKEYSSRINTLSVFSFQDCKVKTVYLEDMGAEPTEKIYTYIPNYIKGNHADAIVVLTNTHAYFVDTNLVFLKRERLTDMVPSAYQVAYRLVDDVANTWFTTSGGGAWLLQPSSGVFQKSDLSVLFANAVPIGEVGNKCYWWDRKQFVLYEIENNNVTDRLSFGFNADIRSIAGNDSLLFPAGHSGVYQYSRNTKKIERIEEVYDVKLDTVSKYYNHKVIYENNRAVFEYTNRIRRNGNVLYTMAPDFVIRTRLGKKTLSVDVLSNERFIDAYCDEIKHVSIFYNNQKLLIHNEVSDKDVVFNFDDLNGLGIQNIKQVMKDKFDNLFILDDINLFVCNARERKFRRIKLNINLKDAFIKLSDEKLIVAGSFGVGYAAIKGPLSIGSLFIIPNSKQHNYHFVERATIAGNGYMTLTTDNGLFTFSLDSVPKNIFINTSDKNFFHIVLSSPFEAMLDGNDTIAVKQGDDKISLDAVNDHGKGQVKYRYRIKSGQWQESSSGEIFLGALAPGKYWRIDCLAKDDLWESRMMSFYIYRYPHWWQTSGWKTTFWVAGIFLFISFLLSIMLLTRHFVARKNERRRMLTDLELRAIHSQINPHFIFNTLSAALFFISKKRFDDAYIHVSKFSQLLRSYLKSSHDRYTILDEEIKMLRNYIELQQIRFEQKFEYAIEIDNKLPLNNLRIPSLLLQPLVENAINHGLFHRKEGGYLLVKFLQGNDSSELICIIEDNGVGRVASRIINETSATKDSYGTKLTNQLLEVFKQYENLDIKFDYTDKVSPETGTIVTLRLKNIKYVT